MIIPVAGLAHNMQKRKSESFLFRIMSVLGLFSEVFVLHIEGEIKKIFWGWGVGGTRIATPHWIKREKSNAEGGGFGFPDLKKGTNKPIIKDRDL